MTASDPTVHIYAPPSVAERRIRRCPTCKRRRRFVGLVSLWHDTIWTCCGCGDSWSIEGRMERPFARGWRAAEIRRAKANWAEGMSRVQVSVWLTQHAIGGPA